MCGDVALLPRVLKYRVCETGSPAASTSGRAAAEAGAGNGRAAAAAAAALASRDAPADGVVAVKVRAVTAWLPTAEMRHACWSGEV